MIEKMKKVTLIVSEKDRESFVMRLRKEGVVHIKHLKMPSSHEVRFIEEKISKLERMIADLRPYSDGEIPEKHVHEKEILLWADKIGEISREKSEIEAAKGEAARRLEWFNAWGDADPSDLGLFRKKGLYLRFYCLNKNQYGQLPPEARTKLIKREKGYFYVVFFSTDQAEKLPFDESVPPEESREDLCVTVEKQEKKAAELEEILKEKAKRMHSILKCLEKLNKEHESVKVRFGMRQEGVFAYLQGYCPARAGDRIRDLARNHHIGYVIEEPDDPEDTPTLITNPGWIKIISPVFQFMNTLPGYKEFDISFIFLVFFSLFFAMLVGDAGYGMLFLCITFLAQRKLRGIPREPVFLMYVLSGATVAWGAVTGTWFGAETIAKLPGFSNIIIESVSSFGQDNQTFMIYICFVIGVAHLTIAHLMRAVRVINSLMALAEFGWMFILWGMFFLAGTLVIGRPFPNWGVWLYAAGIPMVLFFTNPGKGILKGAMETLGNLPLSVISSFSDIVSYLRLFAVGYASVIVAKSFNGMAMGSGIHGILSGLVAALILFFGHALNIALAFMAVIVHGVRLNMLEFSGHLGMQWSGKKYEPFKE
ncbi:MAG: hypothetical protein ABH883_03085 [Candidatus Omnitrophota bacterium]